MHSERQSDGIAEHVPPFGVPVTSTGPLLVVSPSNPVPQAPSSSEPLFIFQVPAPSDKFDLSSDLSYVKRSGASGSRG